MSRRFAFLLVLFACGGCELIADFDRAKIPGQTQAGGGAEPPRPDASTTVDGGADAGTDSGADGGTDAGTDGGMDSGSIDDDAG